MSKIYRQEHPEPQFRRENWQNLNGIWQFEIDQCRSGKAKGFTKTDYKFKEEINVPFCPESDLSGIGNKDFISSVWYKKEIEITEKQTRENNIFLNIGACDYCTEVWINGNFVIKHRGGFSPIKVNISEFVSAGTNAITIYAEDDSRKDIPRGKQSPRYESFACFYTRTTGIWQTVWLEFTPKEYIENVRFCTDIKSSSVIISTKLIGCADFWADIFYEGKKVGSTKHQQAQGLCNFSVSLDEVHLWDIGQGKLYDVELHFGEDKVYSYFGMREVAVKGNKFLLNGRTVFQRLVLDQGFYPDGIYTAPTDEALKKDIEISMAAGFNGARLHQKVFEPRFLYHCDKAGYMVWGEYPDWGLNFSSMDCLRYILPEWTEILQRDINHPSIIGWCPFNETWWFGEQNCQQDNDLMRIIYQQTKAIDPSRLCLDNSGSIHVATDMFEVHDYEQNVEAFTNKYAHISETGEVPNIFSEKNNKYDGKMPVFMSEYGGIGLCIEGNAWSYGEQTKSVEEYYERYKGLTHSLIDNPAFCALCFTQLYDVEQEQNGLYTYDRKPKIDISRIKEINIKTAAIEKGE